MRNSFTSGRTRLVRDRSGDRVVAAFLHGPGVAVGVDQLENACVVAVAGVCAGIPLAGPGVERLLVRDLPYRNAGGLPLVVGRCQVCSASTRPLKGWASCESSRWIEQDEPEGVSWTTRNEEVGR